MCLCFVKGGDQAIIAAARAGNVAFLDAINTTEMIKSLEIDTNATNKACWNH